MGKTPITSNTSNKLNNSEELVDTASVFSTVDTAQRGGGASSNPNRATYNAKLNRLALSAKLVDGFKTATAGLGQTGQLVVVLYRTDTGNRSIHRTQHFLTVSPTGELHKQLAASRVWTVSNPKPLVNGSVMVVLSKPNATA